MHMSAIAYNIKKYLKFIKKSIQTNKQRLAFCLNQLKDDILDQISSFKKLKKLRFINI